MQHIKRIFTEQVGGNLTVDFLELNDGRIVGINEECIVLYASIEEFHDCSSISKPCIELI
jgi:hypothetical protein